MLRFSFDNRQRFAAAIKRQKLFFFNSDYQQIRAISIRIE